jgi:dihydrofolate reductase
MEIVVAITDNFVIGASGKMPWHLPADLQHFRKITSGSAIVMGRRTWDSIGSPLPDRKNIVLTRQKGFAFDGATVVHSFEEALNQAEDNCLFVIGGGEIYALAINFASAMYITRIHTTIEGDTFFPQFNEEAWELVEETFRPADDRNCHALTFEKWVKRQ